MEGNYMKLYEIINDIRIQKNISIKEISEYSVSKSTYYRYINGETDLNSYSFLKLLDTLHVTIEEVNHIKNGYGLSEQQNILVEIKKAFENQDITKLELLKKMCVFKQSNKIENYIHYESLIDILIARLQHKEIDIKKNKLYQYLLKTDTWTRYELIMFNNSMFFFNVSATKYILNRAIPSLKNISKLHSLGEESFRLVVNAVVFFIHNNEINDAIKYIKLLNSIEILSDHIYEKIILKMLNNLPGYLLNEEKAIFEINKCIEFLSFIDAKPLDRMFSELFEDLKKIYVIGGEKADVL